VNGCYKVVNRNLEWSVAGLECRSLHGDAHTSSYGLGFWTAGQRIDPTRESTFVWRVTSTNTYSDTLSTMSYTNWATGQPNFYRRKDCCIMLQADRSYTWNDQQHSQRKLLGQALWCSEKRVGLRRMSFRN